MTPSDQQANYSGSRFHNAPDDEPEQLHKEPESASLGGLSALVTVSTNTTTTTTTTGSKITAKTTQTDGHVGVAFMKEEDKVELVEVNLKHELFEDECEADMLTSLLVHVEEVKRELDFLRASKSLTLSSAAALITDGNSKIKTISDGCDNNVNASNRQEVETKDKTANLNQETMRNSSTSSSLFGEPERCATAGVLTGNKNPHSSENMEVDDLKSQYSGGGDEGFDLHRCNSASSLGSLSYLNSEILNDHLEASCSEEDNLKGRGTNNTILIIQHLIQKRNELRIIDKQLFEILLQYLIKLNSFPVQNGKCKQDDALRVSQSIDHRQVLNLRPQVLKTRLSKQHHNPYFISDTLQMWPSLSQATSINLPENQTIQHHEAIDLSLEGKTRRRSSRSLSGGQSLLLPSPSYWQDSYDSTRNSNNGSTGISAINPIASDSSNYNGQQQLSVSKTGYNKNHRPHNDSNANNSTNAASQTTTKKQFTVNLKKSRLLGANLSDCDRQIRPKISETATTNTQQQCSIYNNDGDDSSTGLEQTHRRASPLNLLKRYRTISPPPTLLPPSPSATTNTSTSATMAMSPPIASTSSAPSLCKSERQNANQSNEFQQSRQIVLPPVSEPILAVSSVPMQQMPLEAVTEAETPHTPVYKKFRSVADMMVNDDIDQRRQVVANRYGSVPRHHENDAAMTLVSQDPNETVDYSPRRAVMQQFYQHSAAFDYSNHQHQQQQQSTSLIPGLAADYDDNLNAHLIGDADIGNSIPKYSINQLSSNNCFGSNKQLTPFVDQNCYMSGNGQISQQTVSQNQLLMPLSHLNDLCSTTSCNLLTVAPNRLKSREALEMMRIDKDNDNNQQQYLLSGAPKLLSRNSQNQDQLQVQRDFPKICYRCHVCGSSFEDRHRLQQHLSIHLNLHPSWFEEKTIKETMARYESKRGDYLCSSCNQRFETTAEFDRHMHLHGDKPHQCELCNQDNKLVSFRYYRQLLTHLRSHCFLYSCRFVPDCKQTANRKDYLKLHILKHHLNNKLPDQYTVCCH